MFVIMSTRENKHLIPRTPCVDLSMHNLSKVCKEGIYKYVTSVTINLNDVDPVMVITNMSLLLQLI